jgi:hypothetical protein
MLGYENIYERKGLRSDSRFDSACALSPRLKGQIFWQVQACKTAGGALMAAGRLPEPFCASLPTRAGPPTTRRIPFKCRCLVQLSHSLDLQ